MITPLGDQALLVELGGAIDDATLRRVQQAARRIGGARIAGVTDVVPAYTSVAVHFDPSLVGAERAWAHVRDQVEQALARDGVDESDRAPRDVAIPVQYGAEHGPDLAAVAEQCGMSADEVVRRHAAATYRVHLIGFAPGFAYLGGLDPALVTPRRDEPRTRVPAGSVGIGGAQTGVYPFESPGGWQLIGRTAAVMFDPSRLEPALVRVGDIVRFVAER